jgi:tetratricopeptide (TPR) repeat protein
LYVTLHVPLLDISRMTAGSPSGRSDSRAPSFLRSPALLLPAGAAIGGAVVAALGHLAGGASIDLSAAGVSELRALGRQRPRDPHIPALPAARFLAEQRYPEAGRELRQALAIDGDDPEALMLRGPLANLQHYCRSAQQAFERALTAKPDYAPARLRLGMLYVERSEVREGLQAFERYVVEESMDDSGWALLGLAAFGAGDSARAEAAMSRAFQLAPDAPNYHVALDGFLLARPQDDAVLDRAIAELRAAVRLDPGEWLGHYRLATALLRRQELAGAAALPNAFGYLSYEKYLL